MFCILCLPQFSSPGVFNYLKRLVGEEEEGHLRSALFLNNCVISFTVTMEKKKKDTTFKCLLCFLVKSMLMKIVYIHAKPILG